MVALKAKGSQQKADDSRQKERGQRQMRTRSQNYHKWTLYPKTPPDDQISRWKFTKIEKILGFRWKFCYFLK